MYRIEFRRYDFENESYHPWVCWDSGISDMPRAISRLLEEVSGREVDGWLNKSVADDMTLVVEAWKSLPEEQRSDRISFSSYRNFGFRIVPHV